MNNIIDNIRTEKVTISKTGEYWILKLILESNGEIQKTRFVVMDREGRITEFSSCDNDELKNIKLEEALPIGGDYEKVVLETEKNFLLFVDGSWHYAPKSSNNSLLELHSEDSRIDESKVINISSLVDLQKIGSDPDYPEDGVYRLIDDIIVVSDIDYTPVERFCGKLLGDYHVIKNLTIYSENRTDIGLFREIGEKAKIENLIIENMCILDAGGYAGAIAGINYGTIENCCIYNIEIEKTYDVSCCYVGAIAGVNENTGSIINCYSCGTIEADNIAGGICGSNKGKIIDSITHCKLILKDRTLYNKISDITVTM